MSNQPEKGQHIAQFNEGLNTDQPLFRTSEQVMTFAKNVTLVTNNGNEVILQNERGMSYKTVIPNSDPSSQGALMVPLAAQSFRGVAFIISAEVLPNGQFTGKGEVGTFPSPPTITPGDVGTLEEVYRPLRNYLGDAVDPSSAIEAQYTSPLKSSFFNFKKENELQIVAVQQAFNGSLNVIFTDNDNPPRLVNSGFIVLKDERYEIPNPSLNPGVDFYLYDRDSFTGKINHILTSKKIAQVDFSGQGTGGRLACGTYRYFFKYSSQNGNLTDFIAESNNVPVYVGQGSLNQVRGGVENERSDKTNVFTLSNLDTSFSEIKVYFSYAADDFASDSDVRVFEIENGISINGNSVEFVHTGFENTLEADDAELNLEFSSIDTYKSGAEVQGRLFVGNITVNDIDLEILENFARQIQIVTETYEIEVPNSDDLPASTDDWSVPTDLNSPSANFQGWREGYANPRNVHDYVGTFGGESYIYAVGFIMNNGGRTPVFPLRGIDNLEGNASYSAVSDLGKDFYDNVTGENTKGIYRFPRRNNQAQPQYHLKPTSRAATAMTAGFDFPSIPQYILDNTQGCFFVRAKRKPDMLFQGAVINTMIFPDAANYLLDGNQRLNRYDYQITNSKYVPVLRYVMESQGRTRDDGNQIRTDDSDDPLFVGITPVSFSLNALETFGNNGAGSDIDFYKGKKFALISPDHILNEQDFNISSQSSYSMVPLANMNLAYQSQSERAAGRDAGGITKTPNTEWFNLYLNDFNTVPAAYDGAFITNISLDPTVSETSSKTANGFSTELEHVGLFESSYTNDAGNNNWFAYFMTGFNNYLGLSTENAEFPVLDNPENNYGIPVGNTSGVFIDSQNSHGQFDIGDQTVAAVLINVYNQGGIRSTANLNVIYQPQFETYFQIGQPGYWSTAIRDANGGDPGSRIITDDNVLGGSADVVDFGGDCFIGSFFRKIYFNNKQEGESIETIYNTSGNEQLSRMLTGQSIVFTAECVNNPYFRNTEVVNETEGIREFFPFGLKNVPFVNDKFGEDTDFRNGLRIPESDAFNVGYEKTDSRKLYIAATAGNLFTQNQFDTRIWGSDYFIESAFDNGYRRFAPAAFRDYPKKLGPITKLLNYNGQLLSVHRDGVILIPIQQRIGGIGDNAGDVFFASSDILPPANAVNYVSERHGSDWIDSVVMSENAPYFVDIERAKIARVEGTQLKFISDLKVQKFLRQIKKEYEGKSSSFLERNIRSYYDPFKQGIVFTFNNNSGEGTDFGQGFYTLVYNEFPMGQWQSFFDYHPVTHFNIRDRVFSFNFRGNSNNQMFEHYINPERGVYYGTQQGFVLEYIISAESWFSKSIDNMMLITSPVYPIRIEYSTPLGDFVQTIIPEHPAQASGNAFKNLPTGSLPKYNASYTGDNLKIRVIKDSSDINPNPSPDNRKIRGKYVRIRFVYDTLEECTIQAIRNDFTINRV